MAIVLAIGTTSVPAGATPDVPAPEQTALATPSHWTYTTTEVWLRQCATFNCGYHVLPAGTNVRVYCYTSNAGLTWNVARTEGNLAGHLDATAVAVPNWYQSCDNAGTQLWRSQTELWAHSCPAMACGYGVVPPGHDIADLSGSTEPSEGYSWTLIIDHDNVHKNLVGWVHTEDID
ncbi:hypothetical protein [Lentzea sp. HUAS12]|uniref:hypothetical protein n=1 Tax=Lentzea sp. HUAS12 TaxID=2951806 RepID=UPI0020A11F84|nr:hypothetical protein [Lentzea sp. HUAS12]USX52654.1 hypothetical protein ND450_00730 [Lentzea sp. HUAS12]